LATQNADNQADNKTAYCAGAGGYQYIYVRFHVLPLAVGSSLN
jgi:hypothetical protein